MHLTIEKLVYGGDGLARIPSGERTKAVFVPFVLEGEKIDARLIDEKPGMARARADEVIEPSPQRTEPLCPYFFRCGGCHYQHTTYEHQLQIKAAIQVETIRRLAKIEVSVPPVVHPSPAWNYRNRTRLKVAHAPEFSVGYFRFASHDLLAVEQCPISSPLINRAIETVWKVGRAGKMRGVSEIELFANAEDDRLLVELFSNQPAAVELKQTAEALRREMPEMVGVSAFRPSRRDEDPEYPGVQLAGEASLSYNTQAASYFVSAGSFFQANRHLTDELVSVVCKQRLGAVALDLYAGVGLFSLPLAKTFERVVAVEAAPASAADLERNAPRNVKPVRATTEQYLERMPKKQRPDLIVVDPPRGGLGKRVCERLAQISAPEITYVSCDPATLARDLHAMVASGYRIAELHLVDLFPQTFHIESVVRLLRA